MKHLQLAIASIVDANTGSSLVHGNAIETGSFEKRAREIRARSILALFASLSDSLAALLANYRERARQRRALGALSALSDYYLEDIGLTRGDVTAVELGQLSLESLNAERRVRLSGEAREMAGVVSVGASNEDNYVEARRA